MSISYKKIEKKICCCRHINIALYDTTFPMSDQPVETCEQLLDRLDAEEEEKRKLLIEHGCNRSSKNILFNENRGFSTSASWSVSGQWAYMTFNPQFTAFILYRTGGNFAQISWGVVPFDTSASALCEGADLNLKSMIEPMQTEAMLNLFSSNEVQVDMQVIGTDVLVTFSGEGHPSITKKMAIPQYDETELIPCVMMREQCQYVKPIRNGGIGFVEVERGVMVLKFMDGSPPVKVGPTQTVLEMKHVYKLADVFSRGFSDPLKNTDTPADPHTWSVEDIVTWLTGLKVDSDDVVSFKEEEVDGAMMMNQANDRDLEDLGVSKKYQRAKIIVHWNMLVQSDTVTGDGQTTASRGWSDEEVAAWLTCLQVPLEVTECIKDMSIDGATMNEICRNGDHGSLKELRVKKKQDRTNIIAQWKTLAPCDGDGASAGGE